VNTDFQFEQFTLNLFSTPAWVLDGHLFDEINGFLRDTRFTALSFGLSFPVTAKEIAMSAQ
jgi:hypothetical protein